MLNLSIAGTLGRDAELKTLGAGNQVLNFSVAVNGYDTKAREKTTTWVRVAVWGKRGETLVTMLTKGARVALSGAMKLTEYNGKTSIEVSAQDVTLLGGGGEGAGSPRGGSQRSSSGGGGSGSGRGKQQSFPDGPGEDDDIPFIRYDIDSGVCRG